MSVVLCVGGLDPAGRAGLLADARAVEGLGARALCVASALTFQSSKSARGYKAVDSEVLRRQLSVLIDDEPIAAVKLGQLGSLENARLLSQLLPPVPLVVDTPLVTSTGIKLLPSHDVLAAYTPLLERAALVTPNAVEIFSLVGSAHDDPVDAVAKLPARAVLLKGGHAAGDVVVDRLFVNGQVTSSWSSDRLSGRFRGTGCRLASAIAAGLSLEVSLGLAIGRARQWLIQRLREETMP